jgi:hypothetical protein
MGLAGGLAGAYAIGGLGNAARNIRERGAKAVAGEWWSTATGAVGDPLFSGAAGLLNGLGYSATSLTTEDAKRMFADAIGYNSYWQDRDAARSKSAAERAVGIEKQMLHAIDQSANRAFGDAYDVVWANKIRTGFRFDSSGYIALSLAAAVQSARDNAMQRAAGLANQRAINEEAEADKQGAAP